MACRYLDNDTLAQLVDELYDEVCVYDSQYRMVYINKACQRHYGYTPEDLIGKELMTFEHEQWWDMSILPHVYQDKKPYAIRQKTLTGSNLFTIAIPIFDANGEIEYVIMSVRDTVGDDMIYTHMDPAAVAPRDARDPKILYKSDEMALIMEDIRRVGKTDANCLLVGESGTGKTMLAKYMHNLSDRRAKPFVSVNCASLPKELVESELFGYAKGAFTGAKSSGKPGLFEVANHGTILLDEISELPISAQAKLLSAIQEREILPVGATAPVKIDVKIIAATNKDLIKLIDSNEFRADLYYRLNIFELNIPPLRQRRKDITPLACHFLEQFDAQYKREHRFSEDTLQFFVSYEWRGNVRELHHVIERLVVMVDVPLIEPHHLPKNIYSVTSPSAEMTQFPPDLDAALEALEKKMIRTSYQKHPTSRGVAADLSISQTRAAKLIRKHCAPRDQGLES
ncbi:MAG: sigma 54-interacting transcriptional regulator [Oscillospiraceae bacterium]|nr:sigma 54-interacting transcriptional regulator [Oscillospiraceae bacterium]